MVLLTITASAKAAVGEYCIQLKRSDAFEDGKASSRLKRLASIDVGDPIEHVELIDISQYLVRNARTRDTPYKRWSLDALLRGANIHQPPPPPKPQQTPEFKALMQKLREQEEQRQYERMLNPQPAVETFSSRFPNAARPPLGSGINLGYGTANEVDDVTFADVNRQMILIINVLISIVCTSVAVWMAARRWSVPERLGLSFSSSTVVAIAEVAIYMGYIRRIKEAKTKERKTVEKKEILDTWIIDGKSTSQGATAADNARFRKGKHR